MPREEIERLYAVFSRYGRPALLEGCPCCTSPTEARTLVSKPLRTLTAPELEHYAFKALMTWGTLNGYKYFIPRILELTEQGGLLCDTEVTLRKLDYGDFRAWPADEQQAIGDYIFAAWRDAVQSLDTDRADAFLCGAAPALADVAPLLLRRQSRARFQVCLRRQTEQSNQTKVTQQLLGSRHAPLPTSLVLVISKCHECGLTRRCREPAGRFLGH